MTLCHSSCREPTSPLDLASTPYLYCVSKRFKQNSKEGRPSLSPSEAKRMKKNAERDIDPKPEGRG